MKRRRVKITGIGPVTPAGIGREAFWRGILEPVSRVRPFSQLGEAFGPFVAASIDDFHPTRFVDRSLLPKGAARHTSFAIVGAVLALQDAGVTPEDLRAANLAIVTGSSTMDFGGILQTVDAVADKGPRGAMLRVLYSAGIGSVASAINQSLRLNGRAMAVSNQCSSGLDAIGYAAGLVASGEIDVALCGGTEAPLHRFPLVELRAGLLTPNTRERAVQQARPFDLWRTTGVVGEGCCMLLLEAEDSPRRGYCHLGGYGFASDEGDRLCAGMVAASRLALAEAGRRTADVEVINAWGPGHKEVDKAEAQAMQTLFGPALQDIAAVSIKGAIGTPLGAAPAIQTAAAALSLAHATIPPTVNWEYPDPACPLNLSRTPRAIDHRVTLLNAHGLGAVNSSLVLERCE
jgi:3-oxoacyl-(acyl-carrier-protein) synthase